MSVILITGAGSGIGRATALAFDSAGWDVVLAGRRADALEETKSLGSGKGRMLCVASDISREDSVTALFLTTLRAFGRLDVLFNNAAINIPAVPLDATRLSDIEAILTINIGGAILCAREALRVMKSQKPKGGRIINTGSLSAQTARPQTAVYTVSKHAITGLTKSLLLDGRPYGVTACQIDIGNAATDMTTVMTEGVLQADGTKKVEPRMSADNVARTVLHMATLPEEANIPFVTVMATHMPFYGRG